MTLEDELSAVFGMLGEPFLEFVGRMPFGQLRKLGHELPSGGAENTARTAEREDFFELIKEEHRSDEAVARIPKVLIATMEIFPKTGEFVGRRRFDARVFRLEEDGAFNLSNWVWRVG